MKSLLTIDPTMGMAGDMFAAALIGLGAPKDGLLAAIRAAGETLGPLEARARTVPLPDGADAWRLDVRLPEELAPLSIADAPNVLARALASAGVRGAYAAFASRALQILCAAEQVAHEAMEPGTAPDRSVTLQVIGHTRTPYRKMAPYQPEAGALFEEGTFSIELDPEYAGGLSGLETFSHAFVISALNRARGFGLRVHPPWRRDGASYGLFATRSPNRPSPIGLTRVRLLRVEDRRVITGPLDLYDGTPVLDIKPFICSLDDPEGEANGGSDWGNDGWLEGSDHLDQHRRGIPHEHPAGGALHEAQDIILDVTAAAWGLQLLEVELENVRCFSPVKVGGGATEAGSHGRLPVPAPATAAILARYRIPHASGPVEAELLTPTGAALLAALGPSFLARDRAEEEEILVNARVGMGLGMHEFDRNHSNALRLLLRAESSSNAVSRVG